MKSLSDSQDSATKKKADDTIKEVKQMLKAEQQKPSTGLFNYNWDSDED